MYVILKNTQRQTCSDFAVHMMQRTQGPPSAKNMTSESSLPTEIRMQAMGLKHGIFQQRTGPPNLEERTPGNNNRNILFIFLFHSRKSARLRLDGGMDPHELRQEYTIYFYFFGYTFFLVHKNTKCNYHIHLPAFLKVMS